MKKILVLLAFLLVGVALSAEITPNQQEMLQLEIHLQAIRDAARFQRGLTATISLGSAAAVGGAGAYFLTTPQYYFLDLHGPLGSWAPAVVGASAGAVALPGLLALAFRSEYDTLPTAVLDLPSSTELEQARRVAQGERVLESLAKRAFIERMISASVVTLGGLVLSSSYSGVTIGAVGLAYGLVLFIFPQKAESEYASFEEWKKGGADAVSQLDWHIEPSLSPDGNPQLLAMVTY